MPVIPDLRTNSDVFRWSVIDTTSDGILRCNIISPPFCSHTNTHFVAHGVQQIVVDTDIIVLSTSRPDAKHVTLQHVVPAVIDLIVKDNAVGVTIAALASRSEVAHRCNVSQGQVASQSVRESTDVTVATAVVIKSGVPSQSPAKVGCCGISGRVRHKCTGVSERLGVVHPESMAVEEVIRSGNHFVSDQGKEVTQLNIPVAVGEFAVRLRQGKPISGSASQGPNQSSILRFLQRLP